MLTTFRAFASFLRHPGKPIPDQGVWRRLLLSPRVFDTISFAAQLADRRRTNRIQQSYASDSEHLRWVQDYNSNVTVRKQFSRTRRNERLLRVVAMPPHNTRDDTLLLIGPRNVAELVLSWLYGFRWRNVTGIDLYSTNPKIKVMDMQAMTFADSTFDAIVMSHTFSYADDPEQCLAECTRVLKLGGRLVFNHAFTPLEDSFPGNKMPGRDVYAMIQNLPLKLYYYEATEKNNAAGHRQTTHLFGLRKVDPEAKAMDPIGFVNHHDQAASAA